MLRLQPVDLFGVPLALGGALLALAGGADAVAIAALAAAGAVAPALARIDLSERRLPNAITLPLLLIGAIAGALRLATGDLAPLVGIGCAVLLLAMAVFGGMGMGDVKLGAALALTVATLGWGVPLAGLTASVIVGGAAGAVALVNGRSTVAFGPWLLVGNALGAAAAVSGAL